MHRIKFKCPSCGQGLTLRHGGAVNKINDIEACPCSNCGRLILINDIIEQVRNKPGKLVQGLMRKRFR
ncbi:ECs_2282 family putative zinc-binding protein [Klebsiella pneumoniae]